VTRPAPVTTTLRFTSLHLNESQSSFSNLQVIFWFEEPENNLIRALICGPKSPVWIAVKLPHQGFTGLVVILADPFVERLPFIDNGRNCKEKR
jgi:hypothetical protein